MKRAFLLSAAMVAALAGEADAATFFYRDRTSSVYMNGDIEEGDAASFRKFMRRLKREGVKVERIFLASGGGLHHEFVGIGDQVRALGLTAVVGRGAYCNSGCATIFGSAKHRAVFNTSHVGVHGARSAHMTDGHEELVEDAGARETTRALARRMKKLGAPVSVVKKILTTPGHDMSYLDAADLKAWHVEIIGGGPYGTGLDHLDALLRLWMPKWALPLVRQPMGALTATVVAGFFGIMILFAAVDAIRGKRRTI